MLFLLKMLQQTPADQLGFYFFTSCTYYCGLLLRRFIKVDVFIEHQPEHSRKLQVFA